MSDPKQTVTMYRPVGPKEKALLEEAEFSKWPDRLPHQPFFYPVTNEQYASEIAEKWNVPASGEGFVTKFEVKREFVDRYEVHKVGGRDHTEWWIPAEDLEELNQNLVGPIEIIKAYRKEVAAAEEQALKTVRQIDAELTWIRADILRDANLAGAEWIQFFTELPDAKGYGCTHFGIKLWRSPDKSEFALGDVKVQFDFAEGPADLLYPGREIDLFGSALPSAKVKIRGS